MPGQSSAQTLDAVRAAAHPLTGADHDYDPLLELIGERCVVLLGEASHGTHEFYDQRARLTRRLIEEKGFTAVAGAAEWPDAHPGHCYVHRRAHGAGAQAAPRTLQRFPTRRWGHTPRLAVMGLRRAHNN